MIHKKTGYILFFFMFYAFTSLCQENITKMKPFVITTAGIIKTRAIKSMEPDFSISTGPIPLPCKEPVLKPFDSKVYYPAFFCKMELKALDRYKIWIKVHAGDYDRYSKMRLTE